MKLLRGPARLFLKLTGWKLIDLPQRPAKAVVIAYPHTSNWDFPMTLLALAALPYGARWVGKDSLFRWPYGWVFRGLGGLPVNRREHTGLVAQLAEEFKRRESFYLAIAPEGTRRATTSMKSGFYRVALLAQVPLGCAFIDYPRREVGIREFLQLSGNEAADLARIAEVYAGCHGKHPAQEGPFTFAAKPAAGRE